jgi:hypothetical protein
LPGRQQAVRATTDPVPNHGTSAPVEISAERGVVFGSLER